MPRDYGWVVGPDGVPQLVAGAGSRPSHGFLSGSDQPYVPPSLPTPVAPVTPPSAPVSGGSGGSGGDNEPPVNQPYSGDSPEFIDRLGERFTPRRYGDSTYGPITSGILGDRDLTDAQRRRINTSANQVIDAATGLPFGITSTLVNPEIRNTPWGTDFNVGGGGLAGIGGRLSYRNLEGIYRDALQERAPTGSSDENYIQEAFGGTDVVDLTSPDGANRFYAPGSIPTTGFGGTDTVTTPLATSPALGGALGDDWRVISGNTDLALQQNPHLDVNQDGQLSATELEDYQVAEQRRQEQVARAAELERLAEQDRALAEAARQREAEAEAARQAELSRQQRQAEEAAQRAAEEAANRERAQREYEESIRQRESEGDSSGHYSGGTVVTDSRGNAVTDSDGHAVTSGGTWSGGGGNDDNGGGGGGGRVICNELRRQGYFTKDDILLEYKYTREHLSPAHVNGYHKFAIPMVKLMRKGKLVKFWHHIASHRLNAIRYKTGETTKRDVLGSVYGTVLEGISWTLGQFSEESDWSVLYKEVK